MVSKRQETSRQTRQTKGKTARIPTLSLFSGAGGLDLGFMQAGFEIMGCVEIEESYCKTLRANLNVGSGYGHDTTIHCQDIREFDARPYKKLDIECIIGGPPCQTFSAAGRRSGGVIGIEDARGQLFQAYCRVLDELKPKIFVFENVYGLPGANGGKPWKEIVRSFSEHGYTLRAEVVDAADYGVPQHRERLIMVGYRKGEFTFPMPTHGPDSGTKVPLVSVESAIRDLQDVDEPDRDTLGGLYGHLLPLVPEGLNYAYFTAEMGHPKPVFAWRSKFHDLLYKVNRDEPCRTIKAQPGKFTGPFHWKNRHFTTAELKRLQTFPDDYEIVGSFGKVVEQIGNSVPPRLAYAIAASVRDQLLRPVETPEVRVRPPTFQSTFRQRQRRKSEQFAEIAASAIAKKYGKNSIAHNEQQEPKFYFLNPEKLFDRTNKAKSQLNLEHPRYSVSVIDQGRQIFVQFERLGHGGADASQVIISGLRKYLPNHDRLQLTAKIYETADIFHAWRAIEEALIQRSNFFSLIDIYGHYANKGDAVSVHSKWVLPKRSRLVDAINFFGRTEHCGEFVKDVALTSTLKVSARSLTQIINSMRAVRFDIRTPKTHPIIRKGEIICTYPFPLLSPRALLESKARIVRMDQNQGRRQPLAAAS
ncbi:MAG TPA: DNA cytosine methyltransferase [Rhizomicrobium sp.]|nr:DNA cytosine methyltransferase [Rhizomicrobium sp.]